MNVSTFVLDLELKLEDDIRDDDPINIGIVDDAEIDVMDGWVEHDVCILRSIGGCQLPGEETR